jgi:hypothetical protein
MLVEANPPRRYASAIKSNDNAEIKTPLPKAITYAIVLFPSAAKSAVAAPMRSDDPATRPQKPAISHSGMLNTDWRTQHELGYQHYFALSPAAWRNSRLADGCVGSFKASR